jgi:hypothetical protein
MSDLFHSPKRRVARAKEHIADLKSGIDAFFETKPYARVVERNAKGFEEHKIRLTANIPDRITDLVYDAIEALRSSLDQAAYAIAVASKVERPDLIHFPIADDAAEFEKVLKGRCKGLPPDVLTLFRSFKPYVGGTGIIWGLNRIRRQATHRLLIPVGIATSGAFVNSLTMTSPLPVDVLTVPKWNSEKNEMICVITGPGAQLDYDIEITFLVTFGPVEGVDGMPVVGTLDNMAHVVDGFVLAMEAECRRLGLIN